MQATRIYIIFITDLYYKQLGIDLALLFTTISVMLMHETSTSPQLQIEIYMTSLFGVIPLKPPTLRHQ